MGLRRSAARETGAGVDSTVPDAPERSLAPTVVPRWLQGGPAPAGALLRGYRQAEPDEEPERQTADDDNGFVSRRSAKLRWWRRLPVSVAGRIALGTGVFAGLAMVVLAGAAARDFLLHDPRFEITSSADIETSGNRHLTRAQLLRVFGADIDRDIFRVSLNERRADLERLPWVEQASVMRLLPNRLRIEVKERVPVAFVRQGTQVGLVDGHGVLLDIPAEQDGETYSFPVLTGISASDPLSTREARMVLYGEFLKALEGAGKDATKSLSEIDLSDPEDIRALMAHGSSEVLVHFGDEDYRKRYQTFADHAEEWQQQHPRLASVDLRYDGQVVLGMGNTTPAGTTAPAGTTEPAAAMTLTPVQEKIPEARTAPPVVAKADSAPLQKPGKPAVPVVAVMKPVAAKPLIASSAAATAKPTVLRAFANKESKPVVRQAVARPLPHGAGFSTSNAKMFAALAAEHRALVSRNSSASKTDRGARR